jgi:rare lipoprotein A
MQNKTKTIKQNPQKSTFPTKILFSFSALLLLGGCSVHNPFVPTDEYVVESSPTTASVFSEPKKSENMYRATMKPYCVGGTTYCPTTVTVGEKLRGIASWYGPNFHGSLTSNGEQYNMYDYTAAHKTLPINTIVRVTNLKNGRSTTVRINDRGPFVKDRIIDLSYQAAQDIGLIKHGTAPVELEVISFDSRANKYAHKKPQPSKKSPVQKETVQIVHTPQKSQSEQTVVQKGGFSVQIASFSDPTKAENFKRKCYNASAKYPMQIRKKKIGERPIYRVVITGFISIDEAKDYIKKYGYKEAFVVRD